MIKQISKFFLLALVVLSTTAFAKEVSKDMLVDELMVKSGITTQFASLDQIIDSTVNQSFALNDKLSDAEKNKIKDILVNNFNSKMLLQNVQSKLSKDLSVEEVDGLLANYKSPLFSKFTEAERALSTPEGAQDFAVYAARIGANPPSAERLKLAKRLDRATKSSESMSFMTKNMFRTMLTAFNQIDNKLSKKEIEETAKGFEGVMNETFEQQMALAYIFVYKNFSDKDFLEYIEAHEKNTSIQKLISSVNKSTEEYFISYAKNISEEMRDFAKQKK